MAVIGASRVEGSIGAAIFANLLRNGFTGAVYPINPNASAVMGVHAYPDIASVPARVDLAIIVVPSKVVLDTVQACATAGVRAVVVISAGFREVGPDGLAREAELLKIVREAGMRLVGPNCLGVLNTDPNVRLDGSFAPTWPPRGRVGFLTQSGALGVAILDYARSLNLGISSFASVGNRADVSANDMLEYWEHDDDTDLCLLYLESFGNPHKFTSIARRVSQTKPIVVVKSGRSEVGSRAATSHTGSLAGADVGVDALLQQTGVIRVDSIDELFNTAMLLANQPLPKGDRVAIVTNAGGPGILAADACAAAGLSVPELDAACQADLRGFLPAEASVRNPVDMIASAGPEQYERAVARVLDDPAIDAAVVIYVPPIVTEPDEVAAAIVRGAAGRDKPVATNFLGLHGVAQGRAELERGGVPSYPFPEQAVSSLARAVRHGQWRLADHGRVPTFDLHPIDVAARVRATPGDTWLDPELVADLLAAYGIRMVPTIVADSSDKAAEAATRLGFPVAVKLHSPTLVHKTEVHGVRLHLESAEDVFDAFAGMRARLEQAGQGDAFAGVTVQPMQSGGAEFVIGAVQDPVFGHLLMAGLGGVYVELLKDVSFRVLPLTDVDAHDMLRQLRSWPLLAGYRGGAKRDAAALEDVLLRVSKLLTDLPEIAEIDLNPISVLDAGKGCVALDARIRMGTPAAPEPRKR